MGNVTVYIHKSTLDLIDLTAEVLDTSRSEVVEKLCAYVLDNDLESEIWGEYESLWDAWTEQAKAQIEAESEQESESED